jgi:hypothetical protein
MARNSNIDTTRQEFLKESYRKENTLRNKWFREHFGSDDLPADMGGLENSTSPVPDSKSGGRGKPTLIKIKPAPPTPPKKEIPPLKETEPAKHPGPEMRAASPETKNMIYTGLSSEGNGRVAYLVKRKNIAPEDKFEYPLTSSLEVGWNIKKIAETSEIKEVHYGKSRIVRDTFFAESGVM